jgi:hypothetical protein
LADTNQVTASDWKRPFIFGGCMAGFDPMLCFAPTQKTNVTNNKPAEAGLLRLMLTGS